MDIQKTLPEEQGSREPIELPIGLPEGAEIQRVAFVNAADPAQTNLMEFKEPRACQAILIMDTAGQPPAHVTMLLVPTSGPEDPDLIMKVWNWVEPGIPQERRRGFLIMLHGARIIWSPGRAGLIASADRLEALRHAVIGFSFYDGETRDVETQLARIWPHLEADTPQAFHFDMQAMPKQRELAQRYQQIVRLRSRIVRIDPAIHHPPVHPPTLASQLNERLKERTQLSERIEFLDDQLELLEGVYEMCAHRSSEFVIAQKEYRLGWIVIVLLATETVALIVDLLAANWI